MINIQALITEYITLSKEKGKHFGVTDKAIDNFYKRLMKKKGLPYVAKKLEIKIKKLNGS